MKDKDRIIVGKIIKYLNSIGEYSTGMEFNEFENDQKTQYACAFLFGQIGELIKKLSDEFLEDFTEIQWHKIKGMRNRIVHEYENIDLSIVWYVITEDVPNFTIQLDDIMQRDKQ